MSMTTAGKRGVFVVGLLVYLVALGLLLAGFSGTYWMHVNDVVTEKYIGLWRGCYDYGYKAGCEEIALGEMPAWFQSVVALMIIALVFALISGATCVFLAVTSCTQSITGVFILVATCMFATKLEHTRNSHYLSWSFTAAVVSGVVFTLNGIGLGVAAYKAGCEPKAVPLPCYGKKQEEWKWRVYDL